LHGFGNGCVETNAGFGVSKRNIANRETAELPVLAASQQSQPGFMFRIGWFEDTGLKANEQGKTTGKNGVRIIRVSDFPF
jgi:hypothetical protein